MYLKMKEHPQNKASRLWDLPPQKYLKIPDLMGIWNLSNVCPLFLPFRSTVLPALVMKTIIQISGCTVGITGQDTEIKYFLVMKSHAVQSFPKLGPLLAVDLIIKMSFLINLLSIELCLSSITAQFLAMLHQGSDLY